MMMRMRVLLIVLVVFSCGYAIRQIRRRKLSLNYSLLWLAMAVLLLLAAVFPQVIYRVSDAIGLGLPINLVLLAFCFFSLVMLFYLTMIVSQQNERERAMIQEIALLEKRVRSLEGKDAEEKKD